MRFQFQGLISQRRIRQLLVTATVLSLVGGAFAARSHWRAKPETSRPNMERNLTSTLPALDHSQLIAIPIMIRPGGFVPHEVNRPRGDYFLSVTNASGVADIKLRFERENGERLNEVNVKKERPGWRTSVRLNPGTYLLTEADHPTWVCRFVITAQ